MRAHPLVVTPGWVEVDGRLWRAASVDAILSTEVRDGEFLAEPGQSFGDSFWHATPGVKFLVGGTWKWAWVGDAKVRTPTDAARPAAAYLWAMIQEAEHQPTITVEREGVRMEVPADSLIPKGNDA